MRHTLILSVFMLAAAVCFTGCETTRSSSSDLVVPAQPVTGHFTLVEWDGDAYHGPALTLDVTANSIRGNSPHGSFNGPVRDNEVGKLSHTSTIQSSWRHRGDYSEKRKDDAYVKIVQGALLSYDEDGYLVIKSWGRERLKFRR